MLQVREIVEEMELAQPWYDELHSRCIILSDEEFKEKSNGESGHVKLWAIVDNVNASLDAAQVPLSASVFKIKWNVFFGYFDPENIFVDNENK